MKQIPACLKKMYCLLFEFLYFILFSIYEELPVDFKIKCPYSPDVANFSGRLALTGKTKAQTDKS